MPNVNPADTGWDNPDLDAAARVLRGGVTVVGTRPDASRAAGEPQLRVDEINAFLARYAKR